MAGGATVDPPVVLADRVARLATAKAHRELLASHLRTGRATRAGSSAAAAGGAVLFTDDPPDDLIDVDEGLTGSRGARCEAAALAKLRTVAGLTRAPRIGRRTADRDWASARAWDFQQLRPPDGQGER